MRAKFGVLEQTDGRLARAKFRLDRFILSPSGGKTPKFCRFLDGHWPFCVSDNLRKLNKDAQLQTLPYPKVSKSFLYSCAFVAKSYAESPSFKSVTD